MMPLIKKLIYSIDEIIAGLVLSLIILLTVLGVFFRYILNQPISWQEEISMVAMVWLVFMGASVVAKRSAHIRIDTLSNVLPEKCRQIWLFMVNTLVFFVLGLVFYYSAKLTLQTQKLTTILKIPYRFVYLAAPASTLLMMCYTALDLVRSMRTRRGAD
jgi:TRAP-type C4-dicarboxylate transport system permease small subunit